MWKCFRTDSIWIKAAILDVIYIAVYFVCENALKPLNKLNIALLKAAPMNGWYSFKRY